MTPNLGNISTRLSVGATDNVPIGGFISTGTGDKYVIHAMDHRQAGRSVMINVNNFQDRR